MEMKFEKIITVTDQSYETYQRCILILFTFMKEKNEKEN